MSRCTCERAVREAVAEKDAEITNLVCMDSLHLEMIRARDAEIERLRALLDTYKTPSEMAVELAQANYAIDELKRHERYLQDRLAEERDHRSLAEQALRDMTQLGTAGYLAWTSTDSGPTDMQFVGRLGPLYDGECGE
jgi:hypothetical protein